MEEEGVKMGKRSRVTPPSMIMLEEEEKEEEDEVHGQFKHLQK